MRPVAILLLGCPASGRRTLADAIDFRDVVRIDPALLWPEIPELHRAIGQCARDAALIVHGECCHIARLIRDDAIAARKCLLMTAAGLDVEPAIAFIERLRAVHYESIMISPDVDATTALDRAALRGRTRGMWTRESDIVDNHDAIRRNVRVIGAAADAFLCLDNTGDALVLWHEACRRPAPPESDGAISVADVLDRIRQRAPAIISASRGRRPAYEPGQGIWIPPPSDEVFLPTP